MKEYHKIQTVFLRDMENNSKRLLEGQWSKPEFKLLKDIEWICTEKIDGTNIRIIWDGFSVEFKGRTDRADIPKHLLNYLKETFTDELLEEIFGSGINRDEFTPICIYGEGFGYKIQNGGNYLGKDVSFILFDIKVGNWWLKREDIEGIANKLNIEIVPIIGYMTLPEAIEYVRKGFKSTIAQNKDYDAEGLICKPAQELFSRNGERIITKIKTVDFK